MAGVNHREHRMSTAPSLAAPPLTPPAPARGVRVWINEAVQIPPEVVDHESFRRWARSPEFPGRGRYAFLNGTIWVDLTMESLYSHNQVKTEFTTTLNALVKSAGLGRFLADGMLLSHPGAGLSTEPDGLFMSYDALRTGRVRRVEAATDGDYVELEGAPEMVLEVVSENSVVKDTVDLPRRYWLAGIPEYWLVDVREDPVRFDLLKHGRNGYTRTRRQAGGWLKSAVFNRSFRLTQQADPLGDPLYTLAVRD
jgi:Uma2 family endonuclease